LYEIDMMATLARVDTSRRHHESQLVTPVQERMELEAPTQRSPRLSYVLGSTTKMMAITTTVIEPKNDKRTPQCNECRSGVWIP
jgi:hypothetical protein